MSTEQKKRGRPPKNNAEAETKQPVVTYEITARAVVLAEYPNRTWLKAVKLPDQSQIKVLIPVRMVGKLVGKEISVTPIELVGHDNAYQLFP
jgi:hypothetical protein